MSHKEHHKKEHHGQHGDEQAPGREEAGANETQGAAPGDAGVKLPISEGEGMRAERDDLLARLQRVSADYLNYQKRALRDVQVARDFANEDLIKALLPVLDDMERAMEHARTNHGPDDPLLVGTELVYKKALEVLGRFGVTAIEAQGKPFDPERHQALMQQPSAEHPPRTVLKELQRGYQLKGRTIRPTSVIVSKESEPAEDGNE